jgi:hypothetical protein
MRAQQHTDAMLGWWDLAGISLADMAVRRRDGSMIWHFEVPLADLPLAWARAENARQADVYVRPARGYSWPLVFLDDVPTATATRIAHKYDCLVVHTSPVGGCHLWLSCSDALDEDARGRAQRWLAERITADRASVSGEHLGRLAGVKNWKRAGTWVNVIHRPHRQRPWIPEAAAGDGLAQAAVSPTPLRSAAGPDTTDSGREWGWICRLLEAGCDPAAAYHQLVERASSRHRRDVERYARLTVARAHTHVVARSTREPRERGLTHMPS